MTKLYWADVRSLEEEALFRQLYDRASAYRKQKVDALRFPADKVRSLGAEALLQHALQEWSYAGSGQLSVGQWGKPYLVDFPELHFSLSHSGDFALCALSDREVGCDIQCMDDRKGSLAGRFFSPEEREWLDSLPEGERRDGFFRLWTLKESFVKAVGLGLSMKFSDFSMVLTEAAPRVSQTRFPDRKFFFGEWALPGDYRLACCAGDGEIFAPEQVKLI